MILLNTFSGEKHIQLLLLETSLMVDNMNNILSDGKNICDCSNEIWKIYANLEYSIIVVKMYLNAENPGRFNQLKKVIGSNYDQLLQASDYLLKAISFFESKDYLLFLKYARLARQTFGSILLNIGKK